LKVVIIDEELVDAKSEAIGFECGHVGEMQVGDGGEVFGSFDTKQIDFDHKEITILRRRGDAISK